MADQVESEEETEEEMWMFEKERTLFKLIGTRRGRLGVLTRKRNEIAALMEAGDTREEVQESVLKFLRFFKGFIELQETIQALLPEDEKEHDQNEWFEPKAAHFREFLDGVQLWIMEAEATEQNVEVVAVELGQGADDVHTECAESVSPHDSVSQAAAKATSRVSSRGSKASEALSEARVDHAVLVARSESVDQQLKLEMEELRIK